MGIFLYETLQGAIIQVVRPTIQGWQERSTLQRKIDDEMSGSSFTVSHQ